MSLPAISIAVLLGVVNAADSQNPDRRKSGVIYSALEPLAEILLKEGSLRDTPIHLGKSLEVPAGTKLRFIESPEEEIQDGFSRAAGQLLNPNETKDAEPTGFVFSARKTSGLDTEGFNCKTNKNGEVLKAFIQRGKKDSAGKPIRGSAVITQLDPKSPDVKARLQRELDFWLQGIGRKKPAAPAEATQAAAAQQRPKPTATPKTDSSAEKAAEPAARSPAKPSAAKP